jgi:hypothetical protein
MEPPSVWRSLRDAWHAIRLPERDRASFKAFWRAYRDKWSMARAWANVVRAEAVFRLPAPLRPGGRRFITDDVLVAERPDGFMLFLAGGVRRLGRPNRQRRLGRVADGIASVHEECQRRGILLVVLLVPDKAHVYPDWVPADRRPSIPVPNALDALAALLARRGVQAVNLLPVFQAARRDETGPPRLYYRDDTHWAERGIEVAMEAVAERLRRLNVPLHQ